MLSQRRRAALRTLHAHNTRHGHSDLGPRPSAVHSLERRDNTRGYSPENCYWATKADQSRNRTGIVLFDFRGQRLCLTEIARLAGLSVNALRVRLKRCASAEEAVDAYPFRRRHRR
jgi:hypothetical protein